MTSKFDLTHKTKEFAKKQFDSWAYAQGLNMADQTIKFVTKDIQKKISSQDARLDVLPERDGATDLETIPDAGIADIALDATTGNSLWLLDKSTDIVSTVKDFVNGKISRADCIEKLVATTSAFVGKIVKGVTMVALGVGNFMTVGFLSIPPEWTGHLAGTIASELFCTAFKPLINHLRKNEARDAYEYLHGFYEASSNELRRQRNPQETDIADSLLSVTIGAVGVTGMLGLGLLSPLLRLYTYSKADEAEAEFYKAQQKFEEAKVYFEHCGNQSARLRAITLRAIQIDNLLKGLDFYFSRSVNKVQDIIIENGYDYRKYSHEDRNQIFIAMQLMQTVKSIIDSSMSFEDGTSKSENDLKLETGEKVLKLLNSI